MTDSLFTFSYLGLIGVGIAVLLATSLVYGPIRQGSGDLLRRVLVLCGSLLLFMGIGGVLLVVSVLSVVLIVFAIGASIEALILFRRTERQAILAHVATAIERGVPLDTAIRAYGLERYDSVGWQSQRLIDALGSGMDLPMAFERSGYRLATGQSLAVGVGWELGCVSDALRQALRTESQGVLATRAVLEKLTYINALLWTISLVVTFIAVKLLPVFGKMYSEFDLQLPWITEVALGTSKHGGFAVVGVLGLFGLSLAGLGLLAALGLESWFRDFPLLGRFSVRTDGAWVLRALAWGLGRGQSVSATLKQIEHYYPKARIRRRLADARRRIESGAEWTDSLRRAGLIRAADAGVLAAAQRAGNLPWALEELAESVFRRIGYRLRAALQVVAPILIAILGGLLAVIALSVMLPLIRLIEALA